MIKAAVQECPWRLHYKKRNRPLDLDQACRLSAEAGFQYWDATLPRGEEEVLELGQALETSGMVCESMYTDEIIHMEKWEDSVVDLLQHAQSAKALGLKILAFNPAPLNWSTPELKTPQQLKNQARALRALAKGMKALDLDLSYHSHGSEMMDDAREFWSMLNSVSTGEMGFCLEPEWILRPPSGSSPLLEKIFSQAPRVNLVHLRQAVDGSPVAGLHDGDIDWQTIFGTLIEAGFQGTVTYEGYQGDFEGGGTEDLKTLMAQLKQSLAWMKEALKL